MRKLERNYNSSQFRDALRINQETLEEELSTDRSLEMNLKIKMRSEEIFELNHLKKTFILFVFSF